MSEKVTIVGLIDDYEMAVRQLVIFSNFASALFEEVARKGSVSREEVEALYSRNVKAADLGARRREPEEDTP